jgi:hypothetical protein
MPASATSTKEPDAIEPRAARAEAPEPEPVEEVEEIATFADLMAKDIRRADVPVQFPAKNGGKPTRKIVKMRSISAIDYDDLVSSYAPNRQQRDLGMQYDPEKFQPALVAECMEQPTMTLDQATALYKNPKWSGGEFATLFLAAQRLCNVTMDVPFSATG